MNSLRKLPANTLHRRAFAALTVGVLAATLCGPALAQQPQQQVSAPPLSDQQKSDLAELNAYTFTMEGLTRLFQTSGEIDAAAKSDPVLKKADDSMSIPGQKSLAELTAEADSSPHLVAIAKSHGFTSHEFVVGSMAFFQVAMFIMFTDGKKPSEGAVKQSGIKPANVSFFLAHKKEILDLQQKYAPGTT